jgi:ABC-type dipeptide/oligopeptide/nickel transport system permease component
MDSEAIKAAIAAWTELERDALHIYAAFIIQLGSAALLRRTVASPWPWLVVLVFALTNEWLDMSGDSLIEDWEKEGALHDLWNTMLLPTLLLLVVRFAPRLTTPPQPPPALPPSE